MNKSHLLAIALAVVTLPIILLQRSENTKLKAEAETLRVTAAGSKSGPRRRGDDDPGLRTDEPGQGGGGLRSRVRVTGSLYEILAERDPMNRIRSLLAYVDSLETDELMDALEELRKSSPEWDPEAKMLAHMMLTRWAQEDPDAAFASLESLHHKRGGENTASILAGLAALDPLRAAEWLDDPENALVKHPWMGQILAGTVAKEWVRQDPEAALAWAEGLPKNQRAGAYSGVLGTLAGTNPERASTLAMNLEAGEARTHIVGEIAKAWARNSPEGAIAWAQSLEGGEQQRAMRETLQTWAQNDPSEVARFLDGISGQQEVDQYVASVAGTWAPREPAAAANWVATQPDGEGKNNAMGSVMWNWTTQEPEAAAAWLGEQPEGPARDRGITGLARAAFDEDEGAALDWAAEISDDGMRNGAIQVGLRAWTERDPEAAREWASVNGVDLPAEPVGEPDAFE